MRRILAASILLVPSLIPTAAVASTNAADANTSTQVTRLSTGVTSPKLLSSTYISLSPEAYTKALPANAQVSLKLSLGQDGKPSDVQVVKSFNPELDASVVKAVKNFRFRPAKLDNEPIPVELNLTVVVQR